MTNSATYGKSGTRVLAAERERNTGETNALEEAELGSLAKKCRREMAK